MAKVTPKLDDSNLYFFSFAIVRQPFLLDWGLQVRYFSVQGYELGCVVYLNSGLKM